MVMFRSTWMGCHSSAWAFSSGGFAFHSANHGAMWRSIRALASFGPGTARPRAPTSAPAAAAPFPPATPALTTITHAT